MIRFGGIGFRVYDNPHKKTKASMSIAQSIQGTRMSKIKSMRIQRSCRVISSEPSERSSKSRGPQSVLLFLGFLSRMASRLLFGALGFWVLGLGKTSRRLKVFGA